MEYSSNSTGEVAVLKGEFWTDGTSFIFKLADTPLSGTGDSPAAAFESLMRSDKGAGGLSSRLRELARDQQGERVRAMVIRMAMIGFITFGIIGGTLVGSAALMPRVIADVTEITTRQLNRWFETMPSSSEERIARLLQRTGELLRPSATVCDDPEQSLKTTPR
jgi:hypothetical protein